MSLGPGAEAWIGEQFGPSAACDDGGQTVCVHCATCDASVSGNTSKMLSHLQRHHCSVSPDSTRRTLHSDSVNSQTGQ